MNAKKLLISCFLATTVSGVVCAQETVGETHSFTLKQAVDYAYQHEVNVKNASIDEQIAKHRVRETISMGLPQINGSAQITDYLDLPTSLIPGEFFDEPAGTFIPVKFGTKYNATVGLELSQLIFNSDFLVGLKASRTYQELMSKQRDRARVEVSEKVAKAYYGVLIAEQRQKLIDNNVQRLSKLLNDTKAMYQNGFIELVDLNRVIVAFNNMESEQKKVERLIPLSVSMLKFQMGMPQKDDLVLTDKLDSINFASALEAQKMDPQKRVEYSILQTEKQLASLDVKRNQLKILPSVGAFASYQSQAQRDEFDFFESDKEWFPISLIGLRVSVPIFTGMQRTQKLQQAKLVVTKVENGLENLEQGIDVQYQTAKVNMLNSIESLEIQKKNMELAEEVFRISKIKYEQGIGSNLEVINAESALKESQTNYFGALYDALVSKVDLEIATGTFIK